MALVGFTDFSVYSSTDGTGFLNTQSPGRKRPARRLGAKKPKEGVPLKRNFLRLRPNQRKTPAECHSAMNGIDTGWEGVWVAFRLRLTVAKQSKFEIAAEKV